jgi:hypothetical protein
MRLMSVAFGWAVGASLVATIAGQAGDPRFDVVSVKPNTGGDLSIPFGPTPPDGITLTNNPLESIIRYAYSVQPFRLVGAPGWTREERFDIAAKASAPITDAERRLMMRALLVDRFRLKAHFESRDQTVYVMTRARPMDRSGQDCDRGRTGSTSHAKSAAARAAWLASPACEAPHSIVSPTGCCHWCSNPSFAMSQVSLEPSTSSSPGDQTQPIQLTAAHRSSLRSRSSSG